MAKRLTEYQPLKSLRDVDGQEVTITKSVVDKTVNERGETKYKCILTLEDGNEYITLSPTVARMLEAVPTDKYPVVAKFILVTKGDRTYWTVE